MKRINVVIIFLIGLLSYGGQFIFAESETTESKYQGRSIITKYPIVLVHGIAMEDRGEEIYSWGRIPEKMTEHGVKFYYGNTDAWGDIESNAKMLKETIDRILHETNSRKVNIIAHSKGGIDSRYMIWYYDYGDKVASLTTISTPHHGSELADLIFSKEIIHTRMARLALAVFQLYYGDIKPNMYNVNYNLTTWAMKDFNEKVVTDSRVYYQCFYTTMNSPFDDFKYSFSYAYIQSISGDNDGLVSETSARWGNNITKIEGGISHGGIIDRRREEVSGIEIPEIYLGIVEGLKEKGF